METKKIEYDAVLEDVINIAEEYEQLRPELTERENTELQNIKGNIINGSKLETRHLNRSINKSPKHFSRLFVLTTIMCLLLVQLPTVRSTMGKGLKACFAGKISNHDFSSLKNLSGQKKTIPDGDRLKVEVYHLSEFELALQNTANQMELEDPHLKLSKDFQLRVLIQFLLKKENEGKILFISTDSEITLPKKAVNRNSFNQKSKALKET